MGVVLSMACVLAVLATAAWRLVTAARLGPAQ